MEKLKLGVGKLWNSFKISLHTLCLLTSAYFVQDGFVTVVDSIFRLVFSHRDQLEPQNDAVWRLLDGSILFFLGYSCVLGLENGRLNLVRWPTLLLFIYKVIEYFIEQVLRQMGDRDKVNIKIKDNAYPDSAKDGEMGANNPYFHKPPKPRLEWTGHFLIPSLHLISVTLFLYHNVQTRLRCHRQFAKFVSPKSVSTLKSKSARRLGVGGNYAKIGNSTTSLLQMPSSSLEGGVQIRRKFRRKFLTVSTSFCEQDPGSTSQGGESSSSRVLLDTTGESWNEVGVEEVGRKDKNGEINGGEEEEAECFLQDHICLLDFDEEGLNEEE